VVVPLDPHVLQRQLKILMQPFLDWIEKSNAFDLASSATANTDHAYHIISVRPRIMSFSEMMDTCQRLQDEKNIYLAVRAGLFRISPYLDNSPNDVQILIQAFQEMEETFFSNKQIH
jgi:hypothetical protein